MKFSLSGYWQLSPLTDLSLPQDDIVFPAPFSQVLPQELTESEITEQEWHLMHDIEVDEAFLRYPGIDLVIEGVDYYAEVRLNGVAIFDCDNSKDSYRKDIRSLLQLGRNRFEILFLEEEESLLLEEDIDELCLLTSTKKTIHDQRMGIWKEPYLQLINHVRLNHISTEQVWHHGGGCEVIVNLYFDLLSPGLVAANIKFNGLTYTLPIDVRQNSVRAIFQVDAPRYYDVNDPHQDDLYLLAIELDEQNYECLIGLSHGLCVSHFSIER
ncbi:glycosyl hydrolase 2 galactose-binding domain-containing protein [Vibrio sp. WJH972]